MGALFARPLTIEDIRAELRPLTIEDIRAELRPLTIEDIRAELRPLTIEDIRAELRPLTINIEDIHAELGDIHAELGDIHAELEDIRAKLQPLTINIEELRTALLADRGNEFGKKCTVFVKEGDNQLVLCHGLIAQHSGEWLYITAAHSVVGDLMEVVEDPKAERKQYKLFWGSDGSVIAPNVTFSNHCITERYVTLGDHDVGCVRIDGLPTTFAETVPLRTSSADLVGRTVVGHGRIFLRGTVTNTSGERSMINASSVPGCSGCPLFDNDETFVGVVHGETKHRVRKHRDILETDVTASANFFADSPHDLKMRVVPVDWYSLLQKAEWAPVQLLKHPDDEEVFKDVCSNTTDPEPFVTDVLLNKSVAGHLKNHPRTLNRVMAAVHDTVWTTDPGADVIAISALQCVAKQPDPNRQNTATDSTQRPTMM